MGSPEITCMLKLRFVFAGLGGLNMHLPWTCSWYSYVTASFDHPYLMMVHFMQDCPNQQLGLLNLQVI